MKKQLILPVVLLFGLVSCTGTDGSSSGTSTTDKDSQTSDVTSSTSESSSSSSSSSKEDSSSSTSSSSSSSSSISSTSSSIPDEVDPLLEEAIAKMGVNYTANVYYGGEITYRHICTDDGIVVCKVDLQPAQSVHAGGNNQGFFHAVCFSFGVGCL